MSRHYSTKRFFREVPADFLARYFQQKGVLAEFDFAKLEEDGIEALNVALEALVKSTRPSVNSDFNQGVQIHEIAQR